MVAGFRRSVSLPGPKPNSGSARVGAPMEKSYHVRSTSLPCRSHPLVSQLEDEVRNARAWQSAAEPAGPPSSTWLRSGLIRLEFLHLALDYLLQLPQIRDSLLRSRRASSGRAERLLDDLLCFVDAFGSFRSALLSLHELQSEAQVAVRRRDAARLASVATSLRSAEKEVAGLSLVLRGVSRPAEFGSFEDTAADIELAGILRDVKSVTVAVSAAVFQGTAAALSSATAAVAPKSSSWAALRGRLSLKKMSSEEMSKGEQWARRASETLGALEEVVVGLENGCDRVFRCSINTRVSLLNILTP